MLLITDTKVYASVQVGEEVLHLHSFYRYFRHLKIVRKNAISTIKYRLSSVYHFWLWTLVNDTEPEEDLQLYFARYLVALEDGFTIESSSFSDQFDEQIEYVIFESRPKQPSTIEKEKRAVESFFKYMGTINGKKYDLEKNFIGYSKQSKYNKGSSYGLRMSKYMQNILLDDVSILPSKNSSAIKGDVKAFPFKLFDELIELAKPRERLLYLLCGATSARKSQALNLTMYDLDYASHNVWLIDPRSQDQLGFQGISRKEFLARDIYNIDAEKDHPHKNFGFKKPIPTNYKSRTPLLWLNNNYREFFFNTVVEYSPLPESLRIPMHPFFFVTKSGKRLSQSSTHDTFKHHLAILAKKYPEYEHRLNGLGFHSLRHMFGSVMATVEAKLVMSGNAEKARFVKWFTSQAMGHIDKSTSTDIYFNRPWDIEVELGEYVQSVINSALHDDYLIETRRQNVKQRY